MIPSRRLLPLLRPLLLAAGFIALPAVADEQVITVFSNSTTNSGFSNPSGAVLPYGTDFVTPMQMDDLELLPGAGGQPITSVTFAVGNLNTKNSGSESVFALLRFYQDDGPNGGPGTLIGSLAGVTTSLAADTIGRFTLKPTGNQRFNLPLNNHVWLGLAFASGNNSTVTPARLAKFGIPCFNPPTVGSSAANYFLSTDGGSYSNNNPGGTLKTATAARSNFCYDMTTATLGAVNVTSTADSGASSANVPGTLRYANAETTATVPIAFRLPVSPSTISFSTALALQITPTVFQAPAGTNVTLAGVISGANRGLSLTGPGTIRFSGVNTFTGGVTLSSSASAGIANDKAFGTGAVTVAGDSRIFASGAAAAPANAISIATGTTLTVGNAPEGPQALTLPGVISGAGTLEMGGAGNLILSGNSTFSGGLKLTSGSVEAATSAALGAAANPIVFNGGTLRVTGTALTSLASHSFNTGSFNGTIEVTDVGNTLALGSAVSGPGALTKTGAGKLTLTGANALQGGVILSNGTLAFSGSTTALASAAPVRVDAGTFIVPPNSPFAIGALSGNGGSLRNDSVSGGSPTPLVLSLGNGGGTASYSGVISDALGNFALSLEKADAGTQTLTSAQLYSGATHVRGGTLILSGALSNSSALTVDAGATFSFAGGVLGANSAIPVTNNGTLLLTAGTTTMNGAIVNNGTLKLSGGAVLNASAATSFLNNGVLDLRDGTAQLPSNLVNGPSGVVLLPGSGSGVSQSIASITRSDSSVTITIQGLSGHSYQLQKSTTLAQDSFTNTAAPAQTGAGAILTFTDTAAESAAFYRIKID